MLLVTMTTAIYGQTLKDEWVLCNNQGCKLQDPYYTEGVSFKWDGSCVNGKANGYGTSIKYENSTIHSTYIGEYVNGIRTGSGKFVRHLSNETWEGNFINGQLFGYGKYKNEIDMREISLIICNMERARNSTEMAIHLKAYLTLL